MAVTDELPRLQGTQEILFAENGDSVARVIALAFPHLRGTHVKIEHAQTCDLLALGLAIHGMSIGVLVTSGGLSEGQAKDLLNLTRDMVDGPADEDEAILPPEYPF